jgi:hypothetical protein
MGLFAEVQPDLKALRFRDGGACLVVAGGIG